MSTLTNEHLGNPGTGPSKMKEGDLKDSSKRNGKGTEELQQSTTSIATELRELINRQDQLLLLLKQSLILENPHAQEDRKLRTDSNSDNRKDNIPDLDELEENNRFAKSYHVDLTLDNEALEEIMQETVNIFLATFKRHERTRWIPDAQFTFSVFEPGYRVGDASLSGEAKKPTLLLEGSRDGRKEVFQMQWSEPEEEESGGNIIPVTNFTEVLQYEWRKKPSGQYLNHEFEALNYDLNRNPTYINVQRDYFDEKQEARDFLPSLSHEPVFGTILICRVITHGFINFRELALTLHQIDTRRAYLSYSSPTSPNQTALSEVIPSLHRVSLSSVLSFAGVSLGGQSHAFSSASKRSGGSVLWKPGDSSWKHTEHHFRFLEISPAPKVENTHENSKSQGIHCIRVDGHLQLPHGHKLKAFKLLETRYTVAVTTTMMLKSPVYSIALLFDDQKFWSDKFKLELDQKGWLNSKLQLGVCCKGITIFQLVLYQVIKLYAETWTRSLDAIDQMVQVLPANILDNKNRRDLMFDRSLEKYELYFSVLQILRIVGEWISESVTDLESQKESWSDFHGAGHGDAEYLTESAREKDRVVINSNWDLLGSHHAKSVKILQERIDRKIKEVESLRDGLFNATQVREATRATRISQYIFVFTVMTIFYLPLSFVATLFGMHLFDGVDLKETQRSFYISAVLIAIVTYGLSALAVWWVGDLEREQELKERWQVLKTKRSNKKSKSKDPAATDNEDRERIQHTEKDSEHILRKLLRRRKKNGAGPSAASP